MKYMEFRAWDKIDKKMKRVSSIDSLSFSDTSLYENWQGAVLVDVYGNKDFRKFKDIDVMLSTGKKDANGVKIFEEDVISDGKQTGVVKFGEYDGSLGFYVIWNINNRKKSLLKALANTKIVITNNSYHTENVNSFKAHNPLLS